MQGACYSVVLIARTRLHRTFLPFYVEARNRIGRSRSSFLLENDPEIGSEAAERWVAMRRGDGARRYSRRSAGRKRTGI